MVEAGFLFPSSAAGRDGWLTGSKIPVSPARHWRADWVRRGHQEYNQHSESKLRAFAIRIAELFKFSTDWPREIGAEKQPGLQDRFISRGWYRQGTVAALVLEYYLVLRSAFRAKPKLRACRTRCPSCGILFLTHPCNLHQRGRIRCPFGCRQEHRRREAIRRSTAYYRSPKGKESKKKLNQRRCLLSARPAGLSAACPPPQRGRHVPGQAGQDRPSEPKAKRAAPSKRPTGKRLQPSPEILQYVRLVVSLMEGRRITRRQVLVMLAKILRQHTLTRRRKIDHAVLWLKKRPP